MLDNIVLGVTKGSLLGEAVARNHVEESAVAVPMPPVACLEEIQGCF